MGCNKYIANRCQPVYFQAMPDSEKKIKVISRNRKAFYEYEILGKFEAGLSLLGSEVKSLRLGKVQMSDSYGIVEGGEVFLVKLHISPYEMADKEGHEPTRRRRLLLNKREIRKLWGAINERGYTIVPLRIYFKGPYAKVEIGIARGKRKYDKRQTVARREADREMERKIRRSR